MITERKKTGRPWDTFVKRQLQIRPLFEGVAPYGVIILPVVIIFSWMMLAGWSQNSPSQKMFTLAFVGFMWVVVLALTLPKRFRWAPRLLTFTIWAVYAWYLGSEALYAFTHRTLAGSGEGQTLRLAWKGFVTLGLPALYFAWHGRFRWTKVRDEQN